MHIFIITTFEQLSASVKRTAKISVWISLFRFLLSEATGVAIFPCGYHLDSSIRLIEKSQCHVPLLSHNRLTPPPPSKCS